MVINDNLVQMHLLLNQFFPCGFPLGFCVVIPTILLQEQYKMLIMIIK